MAEHEKEAAVEGVAGKENQPVKCPFCAHIDDKVIDSRKPHRRHIAGARMPEVREALHQYERIDEIPYMVIKKDGGANASSGKKFARALKACEKRPVATPKLEGIVEEIEAVVHEATERELTTTEIAK